MQAHHMHITVVYDANALITFVEPDISVAVGVPVGLGVPLLAVVITVITVACLIRYMVKEKGENNTKIAEN